MENERQKTLKKLSRSIFLPVITLCGFASCLESGSEGQPTDVRGSIVEQLGGPKDLAGGHLLLIEKSTGFHKRSTIDEKGHFSIPDIDTTSEHTIAFMSKNFTVQGVLVMPSAKTEPAGLLQYFMPQKNQTLALIKKGATLQVQDLSSIIISETLTPDRDKNGLPDGVDQITSGRSEPLKKLNLLDSYKTIDIDQDGIPNSLDSDEDGDGIPNYAEKYATESQRSMPRYSLEMGGTSVNVVWCAISQQTEMSRNLDPTQIMKLGVKFSIEHRDSNNPSNTDPKLDVKILGPRNLFEEPPGKIDSEQLGHFWTGQLLDDGENSDGLPGDLIFSRSIRLAPGAEVALNQVILFQVNVTVGKEKRKLEWGYPIYPVPKANIKPSFLPDRSVVAVSVDRLPFESHYRWFTKISRHAPKEKTQETIYRSPSVNLDQREILIPASLMKKKLSRVYEVVIYSPEKVLGYPQISIKSESLSLSP